MKYEVWEIYLSTMQPSRLVIECETYEAAYDVAANGWNNRVVVGPLAAGMSGVTLGRDGKLRFTR